MRTIKFRGRCEKESRYAGEWVEGSLVQCKDGTTFIVSAQLDNCQPIYHVDPETVCQFTGMKDQYGNELYEHDYVRTVNCLASQEILWSEKTPLLSSNMKMTMGYLLKWVIFSLSL